MLSAKINNFPEPIINEHIGGIQITFLKNKDKEDFQDRTKENVPGNVPGKRHEIIIKMIKNNNKITIKEFAKQLKVNTKTIKRDLEKLKKDNRLKRIGPDKGGYWQIIEG